MDNVNSLKVKLIVCLGNIGAEYEQTRHNAGFWFANVVVGKFGGTFLENKKFFGSLATSHIAGRDIFVLKPSTLMNLSGQSVAAIANFYKIQSSEILVVHDDLDLPAGGYKYKFGGGTAGHKGLKSIIEQLGTPNFQRFRIGIDHPRNKNLPIDVVDYVLCRPEREDLKKILSAIIALSGFLEGVCDGLGDKAVTISPKEKSKASDQKIEEGNPRSDPA